MPVRATHDRGDPTGHGVARPGPPGRSTTRVLAEGVVAVTRYTARAKRWKHGWELHVDGVGVTQSRTLETAERQVLDFVESLLDRDTSGDSVGVVVDLGELGVRLTEVRRKSDEATKLQLEAAAQSRATVHEMRGVGLSVSDIAALLHVSRGRVSQMLEPRDDTTADLAPRAARADVVIAAAGGPVAVAEKRHRRHTSTA